MSGVADPVEISPESYLVDGGDALQFDLADERLNVEPSEGCFSIAWTTGLPSQTLLLRLQPLLAAEAEAELTVRVGDHFEKETDRVSLALDRLLDSTDETSFWRLDLEDRTLTWERGEGPTVTHSPSRGLMGFIGEVFDPEYMTQLIEATATPMIGAHVEELLETSSPVISAAHLSAGTLPAG